MKSKRSVRDPREGLGRRWGGRVLTVDRDDRCRVDCLHLEGLVDGDPLLGSEHLVLVRHGSSGAGHPHLVEGPGRRHRHVRMHRCGDVVPVGGRRKRKVRTGTEREREHNSQNSPDKHAQSRACVGSVLAHVLLKKSASEVAFGGRRCGEGQNQSRIQSQMDEREQRERERARRGTHQYWGLQDTLAPRALTLRIRACEL